MAGRRDFLKRFGIGIAAAPLAAQAAEVALTAPAPKPLLKAGDVLEYKPVAAPMPDYLRHMRADPYCVTTTACMMFNLPYPYHGVGEDYSRRERERFVSGSEMRELNMRARARS